MLLGCVAYYHILSPEAGLGRGDQSQEKPTKIDVSIFWLWPLCANYQSASGFYYNAIMPLVKLGGYRESNPDRELHKLQC